MLNDQLIPAVKQGSEKRKSQNMIPVAVGKQQVIPGDFFFKKKITQPPNPGTGIDNHGLSGSGSDLKTGGIPAVGDILSAGYRY
jgi:hypothetical protein